MTEIYVMVQVTVPPGMTPESATAEIRKSVEFGRPSVQLLYVIEPREGT
jgi:hypothetical protein